MSKRTHVVCLHEGKRNIAGMIRSIDPIFISAFFRAYNPKWLRTRPRFIECGGKAALIKKFPDELKICTAQGGDTTLIVMADVDDDFVDCDALKSKYHDIAVNAGISEDDFNKVLFVFPKDRIENWIEYLTTGKTDESVEGKRVTSSLAAKAAKELAHKCLNNKKFTSPMPPSLEWTCKNWKSLLNRMKQT